MAADLLPPRTTGLGAIGGGRGHPRSDPLRAHPLGRAWRSALAVAWNTVLPTSRRGAGRGALQGLRRAIAPSEGAGPLSYLAAGRRCDPRLVLVHGTPGSAEGWAGYLQRPPAGFEVLAPDRPGFGASAPERAVTSLATQAQTLAMLLPADGRATVVLGHSLGGAVGARLAADHPDRVDALILLAAALDPALERTHPLQHVGRWPGVHALLPRAIRNANAELLALKEELAALQGALGRIRCPVFIVHGTDDDLVPVANVAYAQRHLRAAARVSARLLPGFDHFLPWTVPLEVRRVIAAAGSAAC